MRFVVYRDQQDQWRWRLIARNGNIIATLGEGYARKSGALKIIDRLQQKVSLAEVVTEG